MNGYEAESHVAGVIATKMFELKPNLEPVRRMGALRGRARGVLMMVGTRNARFPHHLAPATLQGLLTMLVQILAPKVSRQREVNIRMNAQ